MEALIPQTLLYDVPEGSEITAIDLAKALTALDAFVLTIPEVLKALDTDLSIKQIQLLVKDIERSSLRENILVKLLFGSQEQLDDDLKAIHLALHLEDPVKRAALVSLLLVALIAWASYGVYKVIRPTSEPERIVESRDVNINLAADLIGAPPGDVARVVYEVVVGADLAQSTIDLTRISKKHGGSIRIDNAEFAEAAIAELPSSIYLDSEESMSLFQDVGIHIRATDKDYSKRGWSVVIPDVYDGRVRMHVSPEIDLEKLAHLDQVRGDVSAAYGKDKTKPKHVFLLRLREPPELAVAGEQR